MQSRCLSQDHWWGSPCREANLFRVHCIVSSTALEKYKKMPMICFILDNTLVVNQGWRFVDVLILLAVFDGGW